jgi:hypothetical protein
VRTTRAIAPDPIQAEFVDEACLWLTSPGVGIERLRSVATEIVVEQDEAPEIARVAELSVLSPFVVVRDVVSDAVASIIGRRRGALDEYELSRHALRALCRGTVSGAVAPRELARWGWGRYSQGGNRESALLYDLYLLDEDYARFDEGRGRRRRTEQDIDQRVRAFAERVARRA